MPSGSLGYFLFAAAVFFLYWITAGSRNARLGFILLANYYFCSGFGLVYLVILPTCSSVDYLIGRGLMAAKNPASRCVLVWLSVAVN